MTNVGNIDITTGNGVVRLRMRHVVQGHPCAVLTLAEIDTLCAELQKAKKGGLAPETDTAALFEDMPETGETCMECGLFQRQTPGGVTCANGHGGAAGEKAQTHYWYHPESDSLFSTAPGVEFPRDGLVEHIDAEKFHELEILRAKDAEEDPFACLDTGSEQTQEDDPFAIL